MSALSEFRNSDWILLVKATREKFGVSINEAHHIILADPQVRRLVATRMNRVQECRKMAYASVRLHGEESPLKRDGYRVVFRNPGWNTGILK